jgi:hypothetical protein
MSSLSRRSSCHRHLVTIMSSLSSCHHHLVTIEEIILSLSRRSSRHRHRHLVTIEEIMSSPASRHHRGDHVVTVVVTVTVTVTLSLLRFLRVFGSVNMAGVVAQLRLRLGCPLCTCFIDIKVFVCRSDSIALANSDSE